MLVVAPHLTHSQNSSINDKDTSGDIYSGYLLWISTLDQSTESEYLRIISTQNIYAGYLLEVSTVHFGQIYRDADKDGPQVV